MGLQGSQFRAGSIKAYFKGNGTNVLKIAPETAIKMATNDLLKAIVAQDPDNILPFERFVCGGLAGGTAQVQIRIPLGALFHGACRSRSIQWKLYVRDWQRQITERTLV